MSGACPWARCSRDQAPGLSSHEGEGAPCWAPGPRLPGGRSSLLSVCVCVCACLSAGLLVYVAMMVGALVWGGLCDKMGRRRCLIYVLAIDLLFSVLSCFAQGYGFFLFFRFCSGFG